MENREIKFRAWDKQYKSMSKVSMWFFDTNEIDTSDNYGEPKSVEHYQIMQFTGLHDKNGKEIYEGDIMKDRFGAISQIVFVNELASYRQLSKIGYSPLSQNSIISDNDFVIGNIHENPELIP